MIRDDYWHEDEEAGSVEVRSDRYALRWRVHWERERHDGREEPLPLPCGPNDRIYYHSGKLPEPRDGGIAVADAGYSARKLNPEGEGYEAASWTAPAADRALRGRGRRRSLLTTARAHPRSGA
jgi:hypothetical protein